MSNLGLGGVTKANSTRFEIPGDQVNSLDPIN